MTCQVIKVDYSNSKHRADLAKMLIAYSADPMGGGEAIPDATAKRSVDVMGTLPYAHSFLCYVGDEAVGFSNCFEAFSTFAGKRLINIHDVAVLGEYRGQGVSRKLFDAIEIFARSIDACKMTLEVLEGNQAAVHAYQRFGFKPYELDPNMGAAMFWQKKAG